MEVFYTSPWVPPEWIKAHGLEPRGVWYDGDFGSESLPPTAGVCPFAHEVVRMAEKRSDAAVVFTSHCDQLRRGFDVVAGPAPAQSFLFNLPATWQTPVAVRIFASELERLASFLVTLGGQPPSLEKLLRITAEYGEARARLIEAATSTPAREYAEAVARFHWDRTVNLPGIASRGGPDELPGTAMAATDSRCSPGRAGLQRSSTGLVPLALVGGPLPRPQWAVLDAIEQAGGRVVLNATEAGERCLVSPFALEGAAEETAPKGQGSCRSRPPEGSETEEKQSSEGTAKAGCKPALRALARRYLGGCVDVFQRPNTRLYDWLEVRLSSRNVRGIVLWHYVSCDLWRAEAQSLREAFGLPLLQVDANEQPAGSTRDRGRIEAFLEALK